MVDIQPQTTSETFDDGAPWLVHADRKFNESITLDLTAFTAAAHLTPEEPGRTRFVLSGIPLTKDGTTYRPADVGEESTDDVAGYLFESHPLVEGSTKTSAALLTHGKVNTNAIPGGAPNADQQAALKGILHVDHF